MKLYLILFEDDGFDDLVISSPYAATCDDQCGLVTFLFSKNTKYSSIIDVESLDWSLYGSMSYEWFGFSVKTKLGLIAVGAPQSRICAESNCQTSDDDIQSIGRVYIYKYPIKIPLIIYTGKNEFDQFGYDFDLSKQTNYSVIAITSLTHVSSLNRDSSLVLNRAGIVELYEININKNQSSSLISTLKSDRELSEFGNKVKFFATNKDDYEDLYISAQMRSESILLLDMVQNGIFFKFKGGIYLPNGDLTDDCPSDDYTPCPDRHAEMIIRPYEKQSRFGSNFELVYSDKLNLTQWVVSSIHSSGIENSRLSGKISLF